MSLCRQSHLACPRLAGVAILLVFLRLNRVPSNSGLVLLSGALGFDLDHKTPENILAIIVQFFETKTLVAGRSQTDEHAH